MAVVEKREKVAEEELEFYRSGKSKHSDASKADAPPPALTHEVERMRNERQSLIRSIASHEKEIEALRSKYDADKQRWLALKSGAVAKPSEYIPADPKTVRGYTY
jgi:predicted RNase H-like nuclease (RuvC/YqgF family)